MVLNGKTIRHTLTALFAVLPTFLFANQAPEAQHTHAETAEHATAHAVAEQHGAVNESHEIKAYVQHHLQDSHDFTFFSDAEEGKHYGFSLPVILVDGGLKIFSSGKNAFITPISFAVSGINCINPIAPVRDNARALKADSAWITARIKAGSSP